jgi:hypothetical protein
MPALSSCAVVDGSETAGVVFDLSDPTVALDERSVMRFARALAFGDGKASLAPAAIAAGAHRSYVACLFAQLPQADRAIEVFGTTEQARAWLANRRDAALPVEQP